MLTYREISVKINDFRYFLTKSIEHLRTSNFSKLFKTWLEVLCTISEENRHVMFSNYIMHIISSPQKIIVFNLDGILEIFLSLEHSNQEIISISIQNVIKNLDQDSKKKLILLVPEYAR